METTRNSGAEKAKRGEIARVIATMYAEGVRAKRAFWSDATWVDEDTCARRNPQNDRTSPHKSVSKEPSH